MIPAVCSFDIESEMAVVLCFIHWYIYFFLSIRKYP
jgi:hypothetical protein